MNFSNFTSLNAMRNGDVEHVYRLALEDIEADPNQPRKEFNPEAITELAEDIRQHGLIQPIIVKKASDDEQKYVVIAGERRLRAVKELGQTHIKAIINNSFDKEQIGYVQIAENLKRDDLKFYELAEFIIARVQAGQTQEQVASELGMRKQRVHLYMAWQQAPAFLKAAKQHFRSAQSFSVMTRLAGEHEAEVKAYLEALAEQEMVTDKEVAALKKRLEDPNEAAESLTAAAFEPDQAESAAEVQDDSDTQATEPLGEDRASSVCEEETEPALSSSFEDLKQVQLQRKGSKQDSITAETQEAAAQPQSYRNPRVLGKVYGRLCTLLWDLPQRAEDAVVQFEDGVIEQIPPEQFIFQKVVEG